MPRWTVLYVMAFWPLLLLVCLCCWRVGRAIHRRLALILLIGFPAGDAVLRAGTMFDRFETAAALVDAAMLAAIVRLSLRAPRPWLLLIAALQLLAVMGHAGRLLYPDSSPLAYAITTGSSAYLQVILLGVASTSDGRTRRSRGGRPASGWRDATPPPTA